MRISGLFVTTVLPRTPRTGGEIVSSAFIEHLINLGFELDVLGYDRSIEDVEIENVNFISAGVRPIESKASVSWSLWWFALSLLTRNPFSSQKYVGNSYKKILANLLEKNKYDIIFIDHLQMSWVIHYLPSDARIVSIAHNVESDLYESLIGTTDNIFKKFSYFLEFKKISRLEKFNLAKSAQLWCLSLGDKLNYQARYPSLEIKAKNFDCPALLKRATTGFPEKIYDVALIGTWTWEANRKALEFFVKKVCPLLPSSIKIAVAGKGAEQTLGDAPNIRYLGFVNSASEFMEQAKLLALPAVAGAGVQIKTIEAVSLGVPIVASPFALRGLSNLPAYVHSAESPDEFAKSILELLKSETFSTRHEATAWAEMRTLNFEKNLAVSLHALEII